MRSFSMVMAVLVPVFVASGATAFAQDTIAVGVKAGAAFATLRFENEEEARTSTSDTRTGFIGGLFVVWPANYTLDIDKQIDESTFRNRSFAFMTAVRF